MGTAGGEQKKGGCGKIILIVVIILLVLGLIGGITTVIMCYVCGNAVSDAISSGGGDLTIGQPRTITIWITTSSMQAGGSERPCVENNLTIDTPGMYLFTMESMGDGDAFVSVWRDGAEVGYDDDGGDGLNSRLEQQLEAGTYQVRACTFSPSDQGTIFTLNVTQLGGAAPTGDQPPAGQPQVGGTPPAGDTPPASGGGPCDAYSRCCTAYTNALSKVQGIPEAAIASQRQACANIDQLKTSPAGDVACTTALNGMKQAASAQKAMPGFIWPSECD